MTLEARFVDFKNDYSDLCDWWASWDWPALPISSLSTTGIIVENNGEKICAAFLYRTDSDICSPEWFISNRYASKEARKGAVEFLIDALETEAKRQGFKFMFASVVDESNILKKLLDKGFSKRLEKQMVNIVKVL